MRRGETGRYETTAVGGESVRAFVPAPLPPDPPLVLGDGLERVLEDAVLAVGRLDGVSTLLPDRALLLRACVRKEAVPRPRSRGRSPPSPTSCSSSSTRFRAFRWTMSSRSRTTWRPSITDSPGCGRASRSRTASSARSTLSSLYLSLYLKENRTSYFALLDLVRREGDWEAWLAFFLEGVRDTADRAVSTAQRLAATFEEDRTRVEPMGRRAGSALRVHEALEARPISSLPAVCESTGLSFPAAASAMELLEDLGIAREMTGKQRNRLFVYDRYLAILSEGTEAT